MGRVYNALVRAERWDDRQGPIGSHSEFEADVKETSAVDLENMLALAEEAAKPLTRRSIVATGTALKAAASAPLPQRVAPSIPRPAFETPAASQPPTAAFEEPSEVVSVDKLKVNPHLASIAASDKVAEERYRSLARNVLDLMERRKLKTLLVSSAEAGEGKTTIAINLVWLVAQKFLAQKDRRRVLLIDATRTFDASRMLGINPKRGWLDLSNASCKPSEAMVRVDPNGLYVMTSGAYSAAELADGSSSRLEQVIERVSAQFDMIVVDAPSILDSSDTQHLANVLDGSVIVARACRTHHAKVTAARKMIPKPRRLGVVLNESDADQNGRDKVSFAGRLFGSKRRSA
jgi:Mrp family chromosome partitioning ATPase